MMRYVPNDKYTIAWFKLAECVAKGEKEKAFGVYRLLMHSFEDQAYAYQLEGDLLGAFQDSRAIEKYAHAAHLYSQNNRFKEAAALYHDLILMVPDEQRYVTRLIEVYKRSKSIENAAAKLIMLAELLLDAGRAAHALLIATDLEAIGYHEQAASIYIHALAQLSKLQDDISGFEEMATTALECITNYSDAHQLQSLLSTLEQTNSIWFKYIQKLLKNI